MWNQFIYNPVVFTAIHAQLAEPTSSVRVRTVVLTHTWDFILAAQADRMTLTCKGLIQ